MKHTLPIVICFLAGLFMILDFSISVPFIHTASKSLQDWTVIVSAFALGIGGVSLIRLHGRNIVKRTSGWGNSLVLLLGLFFMVFRGIAYGTQDPGYLFAFDNMLNPLGAAVYASLAFYISSAGYRAFRARSLEAGILLGAGLIVLLGRAPVGDAISPYLPEIANWIINVPNVAGMRGIIICSAVGVMASGLRVLTGLDRGYLGN
ncbi:MAG TPA: hypothetical protein GX512_07905 [Firmicutes bacterium]|nr:hypothetical protein [Candidatus Fermentithermobacillaceae bacterium]